MSCGSNLHGLFKKGRSVLDLATQIAERLRETFENTLVQTTGLEIHFTVSIGVSKRDDNTPEPETLIDRADQDMYVAKYK
jgi:PleD family two-component response regulator